MRGLGNLAFALMVAALTFGSSASAQTIIGDADTIKVDGVTYRLGGIDAPEFDQPCINAKGEAWLCGLEASKRLKEFVGTRAIKCEDKGPDTAYPQRRIGLCSVDGINLNSWLVREGLAINFEPYAKGRYKADEEDARTSARGIWSGCFAEPRDFRRWNKKTATLIGPKCPANSKDRLFPDHPEMPSPECSIKGNYTIRAGIGLRGIYHLEGCNSYRRTNPQRWFCTEDEAQSELFRKAFTCPRR
jgi:endonuclease YncB( thermonuclease family)